MFREPSIHYLCLRINVGEEDTIAINRCYVNAGISKVSMATKFWNVAARRMQTANAGVRREQTTSYDAIKTYQYRTMVAIRWPNM